MQILNYYNPNHYWDPRVIQELFKREKQINMYLGGVFLYCSIECLTIAHDAGTFLVTVKATINGVLKSSAVREFLFLVKVKLNKIRIPKRKWLN